MSTILVFLVGAGIGVFCGFGIAALMVASRDGEDDK